jgi:HNH endonuclease
MALTRKRLKEFLRYEPDTGNWFRIKDLRYSEQNMPPERLVRHVNTDGYIQVFIDKRFYMSSRLAYFYMKGKWPKHEMDHIDLDHTNNAWGNLRPATDSQNQWNRRAQKNSKSGHKGICPSTSIYGKFSWLVIITKNKRRHYLGRYSKLNDAISARKAAESRLYGEYAP